MRVSNLVLGLTLTLLPSCGAPAISGLDDGVSPLAPAPSATDAPIESWADLHSRLTRLDADVGLLAARVDDDERCHPISRIDASTPRPMGSIFKLYVLGTVADTVDAGWASWDDQLTITDDLRSLPTGQLQDQPDGTRVSVADAAAAMIGVSDNTAAELLIDRVGRDAVERTRHRMSHPTADDQPLLTTREFFTIGWGGDGLRQRWRRADTDERRRLLTEVPAGPLRVSGRMVDDPTWRSGVDWFASADDICVALAALHQDDPATPRGGRLRAILGHNRGVAIDPARWPYVAFKGGSAPGVVTGSWYGERDDGARFAFVIQAAADDASAVADHAAFFGLAVDAFKLLDSA